MAPRSYLGGAQPAATEDAALQTVVVRRGDLVISATGSGTLTAPEKSLGFTGGGDMTVTAVNVGAGDLVQQGEVLAEVDSAQAQQDYEDAQRAYAELTSSVGRPRHCARWRMRNCSFNGRRAPWNT